MSYKCFKQNLYPLTEEDKKKYIGESLPFYRSSWEERMMYYLCVNPSVIRWTSERVVIPYISPIDNKIHNYFVDFYCEVISKNDILLKYLIEVKPIKEVEPPKKPKNKNTKALARYAREFKTYLINQAKWKAAEAFCLKQNWIFKIVTEKDLFPNK